MWLQNSLAVFTGLVSGLLVWGFTAWWVMKKRRKTVRLFAVRWLRITAETLDGTIKRVKKDHEVWAKFSAALKKQSTPRTDVPPIPELAINATDIADFVAGHAEHFPELDAFRILKVNQCMVALEDTGQAMRQLVYPLVYRDPTHIAATLVRAISGHLTEAYDSVVQGLAGAMEILEREWAEPLMKLDKTSVTKPG